MNTLKIKLFGTFAVSLHEKPLEGLHKRHADQALAYLALHANTWVKNEHLISAIWKPEEKQDYRDDVLHSAIYYVRSLLGEAKGALENSKGHYCLRLAPEQCDYVAYRRAMEGKDYLQMETLFTPSFLEGWSAPWVEDIRERLSQEFVKEIKQGAEHYFEREDYPAVARLLSHSLLLRKPSERYAYLYLNALIQTERLSEAARYYRGVCEWMRKIQSPIPTKIAQLMQEAQPANRNVVSRRSENAIYVERGADRLLEKAYQNETSPIIVKGARYTGKSALLFQGFQKMQQAGVQTLYTTFDSFEEEDLVSLNALYLRLAYEIAAELGLDVDPASQWAPVMLGHRNLERFLASHVFPVLRGRLVWGIDSIERLIPHEFCAQFFSDLRTWHNKRTHRLSGGWDHLTLVILCTQEPHWYAKNPEKSPFNMGEKIELEDFTQPEAETLNHHYGNPLTSPDEIQRLWELLSGHPALWNRALQAIAGEKTSLDEILERACSAEGVFGDHLSRWKRWLRNETGLHPTLQLALDGASCEERDFYRLRGAGLLLGSPQRPRFRCPLYLRCIEEMSR